MLRDGCTVRTYFLASHFTNLGPVLRVTRRFDKPFRGTQPTYPTQVLVGSGGAPVEYLTVITSAALGLGSSSRNIGTIEWNRILSVGCGKRFIQETGRPTPEGRAAHVSQHSIHPSSVVNGCLAEFGSYLILARSCCHPSPFQAAEFLASRLVLPINLQAMGS